MKIRIQVWSEIGKGEMIQIDSNGSIIDDRIRWSNGTLYLVEVI